MALLNETSSGRSLPLQPEHVIGRAPVCALRLIPRYVSAQHALIRWTGKHWELKDLSSRNGTFLDGVRIDAARAHPVAKGARMAFGKIEDIWELADDSPPCAMAVPLDDGEPVPIEGDLLALPSSEDPRVTIYRDLTGCWVIEQPDESTSVIRNLQVFEADGRWWRFCCFEDALTNTVTNSPDQIVVGRLALMFLVSSNEEHVELKVMCGGRTFDLGARQRNYLLLTLARRRVADARTGLPEAACGWVSQDDWPHDPMMAPLRLNLDVHRIREQFAKMGVVDAASIIERRPVARQLRIGTSRITISPI
jgi:hypothetical protein